ncbi:uncharacterized protein BO97DRAFT_447334 [Aspergillus homomorphus CBS 101889]|uniref:Uncharacterized protein n=1 Tax=Aspergillus homomorphus (strain CBS 101889) TaxID=1450537 RepID=A0A395HG95_ASPHC|nr:hypothetical protein BO97DRAFT_447334 [Aspergillus homomorphus CBS 101889]RAL06770.1 hypothetical protein BO97DRAFT_447334 [Aspergillus homomorphus CBS 101889]
MSGSNPFRPRQPANTIISPQPKTAPIAYNPESLFSVPDTSPRSSPSFPSFSTASHPPELDDSASSDNQSVTDPFHQRPSASDQEDDDEEEEKRQDTEGSTVHSLDSYPPVSVKSSSSRPTAAVPQTLSTEDYRTRRQPVAASQENAPFAGRTGSSLSLASIGGVRTPDGSTADAIRPSLRPAGRTEPETPPLSDTRPRPLASRSGNRDRMPPPPPPKSHHGRLINPSPGATSSTSQTTPSQPSKRFTFHGTPSEPSYSPRPAQPATDYFSGVMETSESTQSPPVDALRRSQSQYKRPPTPPLSRRHSQMRRSKTTSAKVNPVRVSIPPEADSATAAPPVAIPPSSPSMWSLHPARTRDSRLGNIPSEEATSSSSSSNRLSLQLDSSSTPWTPGDAGRTASPSPSLKRASLQNPPPPPPRRSRNSSNHSPDSARLSLRPNKPPVAAGKDDYVPHPSNANDILADLTRLQKEVDDLRGHYESRKASQ